MTTSTVLTSRDGRVGIITFNRPEALNAISSAVIKDTADVLRSLTADESVLVIVINGAGRAFSAGFDLKEGITRDTRGVDAWRKILEADFEFIMQFWECPKPTIAAVHGYCLAGAFEVALACDITIAGEGALFGEPEVRFGSGIVAMLLPWMTGPKQAKELLLTGADRLDARRMKEIGVVNKVVADEDVMAEALSVAHSIAAAAPQSVRLTKQAINRTYERMGMREALREALDTDILIEAEENPERTEFNRIRKEHGLAAALAWRDAR